MEYGIRIFVYRQKSHAKSRKRTDETLITVPFWVMFNVQPEFPSKGIIPAYLAAWNIMRKERMHRYSDSAKNQFDQRKQS